MRSRCGHTGVSDSRKTLNSNSRKRRNLRFSRLRLAVAAVGQWAVWRKPPQRHLTLTGFQPGYLAGNKT
ncbi:hypothetical protein ESCNG_70001 [Neisseria gonorrhoeae]|nr:hypothetical protein ESCNG_70001 [Neisseria gonorrhoeae]